MWTMFTLTFFGLGLLVFILEAFGDLWVVFVLRLGCVAGFGCESGLQEQISNLLA